MNLRSYVLDPETELPGCVFFHGLFFHGLLSRPPLPRLSTRLFGVPFRALPLRISVEREGGGVVKWQASSNDGSVRVRAREEPALPGEDPETLDLLTNPHSGYVRDSRGQGLRVWSLWHRNQKVRVMRVEEAAIGLWKEAGLELGFPFSALYVDSVDYEVYLPTRAASITRDRLAPPRV